MPHEIARVLHAAATRVWAIDPAKAAEIVAVLALRADGQSNWDGASRQPVYAAQTVAGRRGPVHVLQLHGSIFPRAGMLSAMSGGASLERFGQAFRDVAADPDAEAIVLDVDSPGGMVDLVPETAAMIRAARRADRPIVAVADTLMASAAYWIASAADELVATPSATVGSIGVYTMHDDLSAALEQAGIQRSLVSAGPRKVEGNSFQPLDATARAALQAEVDATYGQFVADVARNRGVAASIVRADPETADTHYGGGRAYNARTALRFGMVDRVETLSDTLTRVARGRRSRRTAIARARLALL